MTLRLEHAMGNAAQLLDEARHVVDERFPMMQRNCQEYATLVVAVMNAAAMNMSANLIADRINTLISATINPNDV